MTETGKLKPVHLTAEHHGEIIDLWRRSGLHIRPVGRDSPEAFACQLATGVQTVIGLRDDERLVAVVIATHDSRKGWINRLATDPAYQRRGLGRRLISLCEEHFQRQGIEVWAALIEDWNEASLALFRQAGYHVHDDITYVSRRSRAEA